MTDLAFELLRDKLNGLGAVASVWIVDENIASEQVRQIHPRDNLLAITNRFDAYTQLQSQGIRAVINDFDVSCAGSVEAVFYRISKEKAVVHHIINAAQACLKDKGVLYLSGYKNEGIKTYINKAALLFDDQPQKSNGGKTSQIARLEKSLVGTGLLDDKNYGQYSEVSAATNVGEIVRFTTKPGVFGWNKIDRGSEFLVDNLSLFLERLVRQPKVIADLGCGYGYLSIMTHRLTAAEFIAVDNNITAVEVCRENFKRHTVGGEVILDDCATGVDKKVDVVICNPPFHQGFDIDGDLTARFLEAAKKLLHGSGSAFFVVNSFIPLEKKAKGIFSKVSVLDNNRRFKLLVLEP